MSIEKVDNKLLCEIYFTESENTSGQFICGKCRFKRKKGNGWTNLSSHIYQHHGTEWEEDLKKVKSSQLSNEQTKKYIVTPQPTSYASSVYGWVDYMLNRNESPSFCEDPTVRQYTNLDTISEDTLNKYLNEVCIIIADIYNLCT